MILGSLGSLRLPSRTELYTNIRDTTCNNLDNASISFLKMVVAQEMKERIVIIADHGHGFEQFADYVIQFQEPEKTI